MHNSRTSNSTSSTWHHPVRGGEVEARRKRSDMALPCRLNRQRVTPELPSSGNLSLFRERLPLKFREKIQLPLPPLLLLLHTYSSASHFKLAYIDTLRQTVLMGFQQSPVRFGCANVCRRISAILPSRHCVEIWRSKWVC